MSRLEKTFVRDGDKLDVRVQRDDGGGLRATVGDATHELVAHDLSDGGVRLQVGDVGHVAYAVTRGHKMQVRLDGQTFELELSRGRGTAAVGAGSGVIEAPMTGTVLEVRVAVGDAVSAEQAVVVLSAMKMEHKLVAGVAGRVAEVRCAAGKTVDAGAILVRIEPSKAAPDKTATESRA